MNQNKLGKIFNVSGKVVILTGAAGRVGSHFSKVLAEAGANLVLIDIDKKITDDNIGISFLIFISFVCKPFENR